MSKKQEEEQQNKNRLFILNNGLSRNYLNDLKKAASKTNFNICEVFKSDEIDFVVTNLNDYDKIIKQLKLDELVEKEHEFKIVRLKWLIDCNKNNCIINDLTEYLIEKVEVKEEKNEEKNDMFDYECQRPTKLDHKNKIFTVDDNRLKLSCVIFIFLLKDALEILEEHAKYRNSDTDQSRALAFRRGICVLRSFPIRITEVKQLKNVKNIGEHTRNIIEVERELRFFLFDFDANYKYLKEIIEFGTSKEIDSIISQDYFKTVKIFNSIFGCGSIVSNRFYEHGNRSIEDLRQNKNTFMLIHSEYERLKYGLAYFEDLITPLNFSDAINIFEIIKKVILNVDVNCVIEIVGGFRRGKKQGHDLDILVSHKFSGEEKGLLVKILECLKLKGYIIYSKHDRAAESDWAKPESKNIIDHFERFIGILRFKNDVGIETPLASSTKRLKIDCDFESQDEFLLSSILSSLNATKFERNWIARRVDIIICPIEQHPFALLGWTGSRQFNRSIRLYSEKEFNYRLTSHGIFDHKNNTKIGAKSEKEIFDLLKLKYLEPDERNC